MTEESLRADKWLWFARFFKSRTLASKLCEAKRLRINGALIAKAHASVKVGDVLTFAQARDIRVVRILALGTRRGPASEAQALYEDLSPPPIRHADAPPAPVPVAEREPGAGRPTKAERRATDRLRGREDA